MANWMDSIHELQRFEMIVTTNKRLGKSFQCFKRLGGTTAIIPNFYSIVRTQLKNLHGQCFMNNPWTTEGLCAPGQLQVGFPIALVVGSVNDR